MDEEKSIIPPPPPELIKNSDGDTIWIPRPDELEIIRKLVALRYTISKIAITLQVPESEFRRHMANPESPVYISYHEGQIESELAYRQKVYELAKAGEQWAIILMEKWNRDQRKEELGL